MNKLVPVTSLSFLWALNKSRFYGYGCTGYLVEIERLAVTVYMTTRIWYLVLLYGIIVDISG